MKTFKCHVACLHAKDQSEKITLMDKGQHFVKMLLIFPVVQKFKIRAYAKIQNHSVNLGDRDTFIDILIAKTISFDDINGTISDIEIKQLNYKFGANVKYFFASHEQKPFFWQKYLRPSVIDDIYVRPIEFDYVWLMDGDIQINAMEWNLFWFNVHSVYKPLIFQPSIINPFNHWPTKKEKHWRNTLYPLKCDPSKIKNLFGIEVPFVENQTPIFRYESWKIFILEFNDRFKEKHSKSNWGLDVIWCNMIRDKILRKNRIDKSKMKKWNERVCNFEYSSNYTADSEPIACLVVHGFPVKHFDTKTATVHDKNSDKKVHSAQSAKIKHLFPEYYESVIVDAYYRAFSIQSTNLCDKCQENGQCYKWEC